MDNNSLLLGIVLSALALIISVGSSIVRGRNNPIQAQEIVNKTYPGLLETQKTMQVELDRLRDQQSLSDRERAEERGRSNEQIKQLETNQSKLTDRVSELENLVVKTTFERDEARRQLAAKTQEMEQTKLANQETLAKTIERMQASFDKVMAGMQADRERLQEIVNQKDKRLEAIEDELKREREKVNAQRASPSTAPLTGTATLRAISTPDTASLGKLQVGLVERETPVHLEPHTSSRVVRTLQNGEYVQARPQSLINDEQKWVVITEPTNGWVVAGDVRLVEADSEGIPQTPAPSSFPPFVNTDAVGDPKLQWPTKKPDTEPKPPT